MSHHFQQVARRCSGQIMMSTVPYLWKSNKDVFVLQCSIISWLASSMVYTLQNNGQLLLLPPNVAADFSCDDWEMRLVGGEIPNEGRLEVCFNNQFGTICDDGWDARDAAVVCGQLGFQREGMLKCFDLFVIIIVGGHE